MPIFEYHCETCGQNFEKIQKSGGNEAIPCPHCNGNETVKKVSGHSQVKQSGQSCTSGG